MKTLILTATIALSILTAANILFAITVGYVYHAELDGITNMDALVNLAWYSVLVSLLSLAGSLILGMLYFELRGKA